MSDILKASPAISAELMSRYEGIQGPFTEPTQAVNDYIMDNRKNVGTAGTYRCDTEEYTYEVIPHQDGWNEQLASLIVKGYVSW